MLHDPFTDPTAHARWPESLQGEEEEEWQAELDAAFDDETRRCSAAPSRLAIALATLGALLMVLLGTVVVSVVAEEAVLEVETLIAP